MKKQRRPSGYTPAPVVRVSIVDEGSRLDAAEKALAAAASAEDIAAREEVEKYQKSLALVSLDAATALVKLGEFERTYASDFKLLRSMNFEGVRSAKLSDEGLRTRAARSVADFFQLKSRLRDTLSTVDSRIRGLKPTDLLGPRMSSDAPGIRKYDDLVPSAVARIQLEAEAAIRSVAHLGATLDHVKGAVTALLADVERKKGLSRAPQMPISSGATIVDPAELEALAASRPGPTQTKADSEFDVFDLDKGKSNARSSEPQMARSGETMADYNARVNRN